MIIGIMQLISFSLYLVGKMIKESYGESPVNLYRKMAIIEQILIRILCKGIAP